MQVPRVAAAHGLGTETVQALVDRNTSSGLEAFLGQPSVNVTALNLDVAAASASGEQGTAEAQVEE
jgi:K+-transporting ATPase ATPase C chain